MTAVAARARQLSVLRRLLGAMRPYRRRFAAATATLLAGSVIQLFYPQGVKWAVDEAMAQRSQDRLNQAALVLVAVFLVVAVLAGVRHYLMSWLGERVVADLRAHVYRRLLGLPLSWFHEKKSGEITGRLAADVATIQGVVGSDLSMSLREVVILFGGVLFLAVQSTKLTLVVLCLVPAVVAGVFVFGRAIRRMSKVVQDSFAETSAQVQETVAAIQTVQSFVREPAEASRYAERVEAYFVDVRRLARARGAFFATMSFLGTAGVAAVVWFGGREVIAGRMTAGDLAAFLLYTLMIGGALSGLAGLWGSLQRAAGATERLFEILDEQPTIADPPAPRPVPAGGGAIAFDRVSFAYPSRPDERVLVDVDLTIRAGEVVALVGRSGAGKSTLASLVQRFHDPTAGRVLFEGVDVRDVALADLRSKIAVVAQDPVLFSGTVAENIAYGRADATRDDVVAAAQRAHAHEFVSRFEKGYDTVVGERGVQLSGGQRQRVAIARAIAADPRVLILDEATSDLDGESEALVQDALASLMKGRTTLVVAHRLSTVRDADRIVVLDRGRVVEVGPHGELVARAGLYAKLVEHQLVAA